MEIILEKVSKGSTVTGVAKIMDGKENVNNVAFNVRTVEELDTFVRGLLAVQTEFATVADGAYTVKPVVIKEEVKHLVQEALNAVYDGKGKLEAKIITEAEYDTLVVAYKTLVSSKKG